MHHGKHEASITLERVEVLFREFETRETFTNAHCTRLKNESREMRIKIDGILKLLGRLPDEEFHQAGRKSRL
jgi:hypothetical protein